MVASPVHAILLILYVRNMDFTNINDIMTFVKKIYATFNSFTTYSGAARTPKDLCSAKTPPRSMQHSYMTTDIHYKIIGQRLHEAAGSFR